MTANESFDEAVRAAASSIRSSLSWRVAFADDAAVEAAAREAVNAFIRSVTGFDLNEDVEKVRGSKWRGRVCGFYLTDMTPHGVCVESRLETGSVQVYPAHALEEAWS